MFTLKLICAFLPIFCNCKTVPTINPFKHLAIDTLPDINDDPVPFILDFLQPINNPNLMYTNNTIIQPLDKTETVPTIDPFKHLAIDTLPDNNTIIQHLDKTETETAIIIILTIIFITILKVIIITCYFCKINNANYNIEIERSASYISPQGISIVLPQYHPNTNSYSYSYSAHPPSNNSHPLHL